MRIRIRNTELGTVPAHIWIEKIYCLDLPGYHPCEWKHSSRGVCSHAKQARGELQVKRVNIIFLRANPIVVYFKGFLKGAETFFTSNWSRA